jgi:dihydrofolate reductase
MAKIIEATLVSVDRVIGDPHVWAGDYFDDNARRHSLEQLEASDAMLIGRHTYEVFSGARTRKPSPGPAALLLRHERPGARDPPTGCAPKPKQVSPRFTHDTCSSPEAGRIAPYLLEPL